jgi:hypothetical protein
MSILLVIQLKYIVALMLMLLLLTPVIKYTTALLKTTSSLLILMFQSQIAERENAVKNKMDISTALLKMNAYSRDNVAIKDINGVAIHHSAFQ